MSSIDRNLERKIVHAKSDVESVIDELISIIQQLELEKDEMQDEIDTLKEENANLQNHVDEIKG